ncbi:MAG: low molecular weight phosphotyrosine protein phosphatase [Inquilinus sp.]|nr:low molecular weight phosphotyrosine protein phosphatase [Inquilinus sp.]
MKILFVCTGNICRSPTAEALFLHRAAERGLAGQVAADSAGTSSEESGNPPDRRARIAAAARGCTLPDRRARRITATDFDTFDLIVAMDRGHLATLRRRAPDHARDRLRLFMEFAGPDAPPDVPDPWYGDEYDFEHALDLIEAGVDGLLAQMAGR